MSQFLDALPSLIVCRPIKPSQRKRRHPVGNKPRRSRLEIEEEMRISELESSRIKPRFTSFSPEFVFGGRVGNEGRVEIGGPVIGIEPVQKRKRDSEENETVVLKKLKTETSKTTEILSSSDSGYSHSESGESYHCELNQWNLKYAQSEASQSETSQSETSQSESSFDESFNMFNTIPVHEEIYKYDGYYQTPAEIVPDYFVNLDNDYQTIYGATSIENYSF